MSPSGRAAPSPRRRPTATSSFGVGRREGHDASGFYARFTPPVVSDDDRVATAPVRDVVWVGDARAMDAHGTLPDGSVALVVTSPPYFAGKEYEAALGVGHIPADYDAYLQMLHGVFTQCAAKLEPGGRVAVNVANLGRKPYRSLARDVIDILESIGLLLRGEIIWQKSHAAGGSCAWGTYQRPGNPVLRDITERIVVASKGRFDRAVPPDRRAERGLPSEGSITMDEFIDATTDLWDIPAESATRVGHPAPFPVELPRRLIELYTYRGDLVLDPFMGSGSTAVAAVRTERHYVGFDTDPAYVAMAERRVATEREALAGRSRRRNGPGPGSRPDGDGPDAGGGADAPRIVVPPTRTRSIGPATGGDGGGAEEGGDSADPAMAERRTGQKARLVALRQLQHAGFRDIEDQVVLADVGVDLAFRARDAGGRTWLFDLSGAYSGTRPGLRRADVLWRSLGKAGVLHAARQRAPHRDDLVPLVLLSTDLPGPRSAGGKALRAVQPDDGSGPVADAVELLDPAGAERLRAHAAGRVTPG